MHFRNETRAADGGNFYWPNFCVAYAWVAIGKQVAHKNCNKLKLSYRLNELRIIAPNLFDLSTLKLPSLPCGKHLRSTRWNVLHQFRSWSYAQDGDADNQTCYKSRKEINYKSLKSAEKQFLNKSGDTLNSAPHRRIIALIKTLVRWNRPSSK